MENQEIQDESDEIEGGEEIDAEEEAPAPDALGPPLKRLDDMIRVKDGRCRLSARDAYNQTIQEFRETGKYTEKTWEDFDHIVNPPGAQAEAYQAYWDATEDIDAWQEKHPGIRPNEALDDANVSEEIDEADLDRSSDETPSAEPVFPGQNAGADKAAEPNQENSPHTDESKESSLPARHSVLEPVAIRGEVFDPKVRSREAFDYGAATELDLRRAPSEYPPAGSSDEETQGWLNAILGECHFLMHEVVFRSICASNQLQDRLGLIDRSLEIARTGAEVGKAIAEFKASRPAVRKTSRRATLEEIASEPAGEAADSKNLREF